MKKKIIKEDRKDKLLNNKLYKYLYIYIWKFIMKKKWNIIVYNLKIFYIFIKLFYYKIKIYYFFFWVLVIDLEKDKII